MKIKWVNERVIVGVLCSMSESGRGACVCRGGIYKGIVDIVKTLAFALD